MEEGKISEIVDWADSLVEQKYSTATQHFVANQLAAIIRKYPFPQSLNPFDPEKTAREKFLDSEASCRLMNEKFRDFDQQNGHPLISVIHSMRSFINYAIGGFPDYESVWSHCDFGPGASLGVHGNATNVARKLAARWSVTPEARQYAISALKYNYQIFEGFSPLRKGDYFCVDPGLVEERFLEKMEYVNYNKIAFVPKTVKTHRSIAVEPLLNGFVQKGIDGSLRARLKRIGIDLSDQSANARFARRGSLSNAVDPFVTIDLSSASDSISIELCRMLLPPDWFDLLDRTRSKAFLHNGNVTKYEKFCSMGNGFCFPLETLIFAAACAAVGCGRAGVDFLVYGDDIIVRQSRSQALLSLLGELGFAANPKKTLLEGPFRESCGADWFDGEDVRPFTLDYELDSVQNIFKFLNLTRRNERTILFFAGIRDFVISLLPSNLRLSRPIEYGPVDGSYYAELDEFMHNPHAAFVREGCMWRWPELLVSPVNDRWRDLEYADLAYVYAAFRGSSSENPFTVRRKTRTTVRRVAYGR
jgi:hypothetical protein